MVRLHGLVIQSRVELPGLPRTDAPVADVTLELVAHLPIPTVARVRYRAGDSDDVGSRVEIIDDANGRTHFRYGDGTAIELVHDERPARVRAAIAPGQTLEDLAAYLYGPVFGFLLRAWGRLALHASCVRVDDGAVLLAGPSGAGKSTTAAVLASRGLAVLSDDLTALTSEGDQLVAWPAFDHIRLWPDSGRVLLDGGDSLERITPTWDKRRFPLRGSAFTSQPCPVRAIILLDARTSAPRAASRLVSPGDAVLALTMLTYANYLLDATMRATELTQLGALVRAVPVHALTPPAGRDGVDALCSEVLRIASHGSVTPA